MLNQKEVTTEEIMEMVHDTFQTLQGVDFVNVANSVISNKYGKIESHQGQLFLGTKDSE